MKTLLIVGSARVNGHSAIIATSLHGVLDADIIHLSEFQVDDYGYRHQYSIDDEFLNLIDKLLKYDQVLLITPVYWYSMSGNMKRFLDRFTDLITVHKDLGYQLKTMSIGAISCGSEMESVPGFEVPFEQTAAYLGMNYLGFLHTYIVDGIYSPKESDRLVAFSKRL